MVRSHYICLSVTIILAGFVGCSKNDYQKSTREIVNEDVLFAQQLFEEDVVRLKVGSTKALGGMTRPTQLFDLGVLAPDWAAAEQCVNGSSLAHNVEAPLTTNFRYRVLQFGPESKRPRKVKAYHELLVASSPGKERSGVFIVFYIATNQYTKWYKGILSQRFTNSGDMKNYSGLKIYTNIEGRIVRINRYEKGRKTAGIFMPEIKTKEQKEARNKYVAELFKNIHFQYGIRLAPSTRSGEDDESWDFFDWISDFYEDDHYYAPEDEIDPGYCSAYGDDSFWFMDDENDWLDDDYYDPDDESEFDDWYDYDNFTGSHYEDQNDDVSRFGNKSQSKQLDTERAKRNYMGYKRGVRDCFQVAKLVMKEFGITWLHGGAETDYRIDLIRSEEGKAVPITSAIGDAIMYITSRIDENYPVLVGIDHSEDGQNDHYIVIIGYEVIGETSITFNYVETAFGSADRAYDALNVLEYRVGDNYISGFYWLNPNNGSYNVSHVRKNP